uniref:thrombospondin type 3 repeat-containing protein n=1 Tax=Neptunomonas sp. TaxID=1971898 RepID=UPI0035675FD9
KDSAPGIWNANLFPLSDIAGNSNSMFGPGAGFSNELTVVSSNSDVQAPRLIAFDFEPKKVNVYGHSQQVIVTLRITDNDSGAKAPHISFGSSTTTQSSGFANVTLVSGDANDGVWQAVVTIPKDSAPGIWNANLFPLSDIAGNSNSMFGPGAGFSDQLTVVNPSDTDGDGLTDAWEVANGLNPNDPRDVNQDKDGDGVSNLVEYQESTDPSDASDYPIWFHGPSRSGWRVILQ